MKVILTFLSIFLTISISNASEFLCTHPQACNLVSEALKDSSDHSFKLAIAKELDPHHHELSPKEIKSLISADFLIIAPKEFQPWVKNILRKRNKPTIYLNLSVESQTKKNKHQLSHFWLYPSEICFNKSSVRIQLERLNFKVNKKMCDKDFLISLSSKLNFLKTKRYVLSHDALSGLFSKYNIEHVALKGSHHHASIDSHTIKKLHKFQKKHSSLVWIRETSVKTPHNIINKKRPTDTILDLDITGKIGTNSEQVLIDLITKLTEEK